MRTLFSLSVLAALLPLAQLCSAHDQAVLPAELDPARRISFPDTAHYQTLVLDPHTHSSFSDGHVWPRIRIEEALRDGLDAIAITEHLEWQPHLADIPHTDRNRAYQVAREAAVEQALMVIPGSEITRSTEAGHINALFITDANQLLQQYQPEDPTDAMAYYRAMHAMPAQAAVDAAAAQGAFLFWNHPWWSDDFPDSIPVLTDFHRDNARSGKLKGIEIANGDYYSEQAFQMALDLDLTLIGASDIHELIDWDYRPHEGGHRPVTLVLAEEDTPAALQQALVEGRTLVWFKNTLMARELEMRELLQASLSITSANYSGESQLLDLVIRNRSDVDFQVEYAGDYSFSRNTDLLLLKQHADTRITVKTPQRLQRIELPLRVLNALVGPKESARISLSRQVATELKELTND
jgi:hypothetical protein